MQTKQSKHVTVELITILNIQMKKAIWGFAKLHQAHNTFQLCRLVWWICSLILQPENIHTNVSVDLLCLLLNLSSQELPDRPLTDNDNYSKRLHHALTIDRLETNVTRSNDSLNEFLSNGFNHTYSIRPNVPEPRAPDNCNFWKNFKADLLWISNQGITCA